MTDTMTGDQAGTDYSATLFLPETDFPMRAELPEREPIWLKRWEDLDLFTRQREQSKDRPNFTLHDGPPYANGNIHIGHALNKTLKDLVSRSMQMLGYNSAYVPGWDCHGLPIEWKIEEQYRAKGKNKDDIPVIEFRAECRTFAQHWIDVQREEFKRLGVLGEVAAVGQRLADVTALGDGGEVENGQRDHQLCNPGASWPVRATYSV